MVAVHMFISNTAKDVTSVGIITQKSSSLGEMKNEK